jgi:hypothetical protein
MEKIQFIGLGDGENDSGTHFVGPISDYTLCGLTLDGDELTAGDFKETNNKVDCKQCVDIVKFCQMIKKSEYNF